MEIVIHRAFDVTPDAAEALELALSLGITRIMTAGHAPDAPAGVAGLRALVQAARGRCEIMAGGGVTAADAPALIASLTVDGTVLDARLVGTQVRVTTVASPDLDIPAPDFTRDGRLTRKSEQQLRAAGSPLRRLIEGDYEVLADTEAMTP